MFDSIEKCIQLAAFDSPVAGTLFSRKFDYINENVINGSDSYKARHSITLLNWTLFWAG